MVEKEKKKRIVQCPYEGSLGFCEDKFDFNMPKPSRLEGMLLEIVWT